MGGNLPSDPSLSDLTKSGCHLKGSSHRRCSGFLIPLSKSDLDICRFPEGTEIVASIPTVLLTGQRGTLGGDHVISTMGTGGTPGAILAPQHNRADKKTRIPPVLSASLELQGLI